ncbi:MAG: PilZ domain-containing protein [Pseudomonadota bacterium]
MEYAHQSSHMAALSRKGDPIGHVRMSLSERRQYQRGRIAAEARVKIHDETFAAELLDISAGGARLRCSVVPRAGTEIGVEVQGIGAFQAKVIRRLPNCIAVEFHFSENLRSLFAEKLDSLTMEPV